MSERDHPVSALRTHVPDLERLAYNQKPKTRDWTYLRLLQYDETDLFQWFGKRNGSCFEDQASEPFRIPARRTPAPEGEAMPGSAYDGGHMGSDGDWHGPEGEVVGNPVLWKDRPDEWTDAILAAHPVNSTDPERHNRFALAMKMVGNRHGKYELVGLVHWLLTRLDAASPVVPVGVSREEIAEILKDEVLTDGGIIMSSEPSSTRRLRIAARILAALRPTDTGRE